MTRRLIVRVGLVVGILALGGCGAPQNIFDPQGKQAESINDLQVPVFITAVVVGILVAVGLTFVVSSGKRRAAREAAGEENEPRQIHGNFKAEIAWTAIPFAILVVIAIPTVFTIADITRRQPDSVKISVYGQQWWWSYEYDTNGDGRPEVVTANELVMPVGRPVELVVHSRDVIHSFWIPALGGTRDAVPGRVEYLQLQADHAGTYYEGQCKEYCGLSHANMRARAIALEEDDYDRWLRDNSQDAETPPAGTQAAAGLEVFNAKCASCHQIRGVNELHGNAPLVAGYAPDLTHLMQREVFASANFPLWLPVGECSTEQYANRECRLRFNRNQLEAWLRNPPAQLPMAAAEGRGMPDLGLSESEIDQLVSYLQTLGPYPPNAIPPGEEAN